MRPGMLAKARTGCSTECAPSAPPLIRVLRTHLRPASRHSRPAFGEARAGGSQTLLLTPACGEKEPGAGTCVAESLSPQAGRRNLAARPCMAEPPLPAGGERVPPEAAGEGRHLTERAMSGTTHAQRAPSAPPLIRVLRTHLLPACGEKEPAAGACVTGSLSPQAGRGCRRRRRVRGGTSRSVQCQGQLTHSALRQPRPSSGCCAPTSARPAGTAGRRSEKREPVARKRFSSPPRAGSRNRGPELNLWVQPSKLGSTAAVSRHPLFQHPQPTPTPTPRFNPPRPAACAPAGAGTRPSRGGRGLRRGRRPRCPSRCWGCR